MIALINCSKIWGSSSKNSALQNFLLLVVFRQFRDLMANIFVRNAISTIGKRRL